MEDQFYYRQTLHTRQPSKDVSPHILHTSQSIYHLLCTNSRNIELFNRIPILQYKTLIEHSFEIISSITTANIYTLVLKKHSSWLLTRATDHRQELVFLLYPIHRQGYKEETTVTGTTAFSHCGSKGPCLL